MRGRTLREIREGQNISQDQAARAAEVDQSSISRIERTHLDHVRVSTLRRYVEALGGELELIAVFPSLRRRFRLAHGAARAFAENASSPPVSHVSAPGRISIALSSGRSSPTAMSGSTRIPPFVVIGSVVGPTVTTVSGRTFMYAHGARFCTVGVFQRRRSGSVTRFDHRVRPASSFGLVARTPWVRLRFASELCVQHSSRLLSGRTLRDAAPRVLTVRGRGELRRGGSPHTCFQSTTTVTQRAIEPTDQSQEPGIETGHAHKAVFETDETQIASWMQAVYSPNGQASSRPASRPGSRYHSVPNATAKTSSGILSISPASLT
jgi:transcriptional regulator with XRE-family HTH domain